jgi:WD40 repeat protein
MPHRCTRCGRVVDDAFAADNDGLCARRCGGRLEPVPPLGVPDLDGLDLAPLPYPVALTAGRLAAALRGAADPCRAVFLLKDGFEAAVKYLGSVLLVEYLRGPARAPDRDTALLERLVRPSLGVWVNVVLGDLSRWLAGGPDPGGAVAVLFARPAPRTGGKASETELFADCRGFVGYRNDVLGHGATRPDAAYAADLARWAPVLRRLLDGVAGLAHWRLCLVADVDRCQVWTGETSGPATEPGSFPRGLVGKFVLRGPGGELRPLDPFVCYLADPDRDRRLHFYDSVYRYTPTRKEVDVLEYDEGFKRASPDPIPALEEAFTAERLAAAFGRHRGKMAVIEGRVANFGELIEAHAGIVGRHFAVERVRRFVAENDRGLLVITGEPGRGKTALLAHLVGEVYAHAAPPPVHFFYRRTAGITDPDVCARSLYHALLEAHGLTESEESRRQTDPEAMARKLDDLLANHVGPKLLPSRPQLVFIDALDEADPTPAGRTAFHRLPADLPAGVYVIATTRPIADRSALARRPHLHWLDLDAPDFAQDHLRDGREYVERELIGADLPEDARSALAAAGAGNFLVLKLLCAQVRDGLAADGVRDFLRRLATDGAADRLGFIYEEFWARLTDRLPLEELRLVADVAGVLVWAKAPLTAELLCRVLGRPAAEVERAVRRLAEYLTDVRYEEGGAEETFYRVYHESFADFLRAKLAADRARLAGALADYCLRWAALPDGYARTYALRFGPTHLRELSRWDELESLLTDWRFLEAKAETGSIFALVADLGEAVAALPADRPLRRIIRLLEEAVRRDVHFISHHPETLFQCLWNTCWWYDCPDAEKHYAPSSGGWPRGGPPWGGDGPKLCQLLESWHAGRRVATSNRLWLRSLRPPRECLGSGQGTVFRHLGTELSNVAVCADASAIVAGMVDGSVRIWGVKTGTERVWYSGRSSPVNCVTVLPDGGRVASGSNDGTVRVWAVTSGQELTCLAGHQSAVRSIQISPDGRWLVAHSDDAVVRIWDPDSGSVEACLGGVDPVGMLALSPDRRLIASRFQSEVTVREVMTGSVVARLRCREADGSDPVFSPDGARLLCGSGRHLPTAILNLVDGGWAPAGVVQVWETDTFNEVACYHVCTSKVVKIVPSGDGALAACVTQGAGIIMLLAESGQQITSFAPTPWVVPLHIAWLRDNRNIVVVSTDGGVTIWDVESRGIMPRPEAHRVEVTDIVFSPDGKMV